MTRFAAVLGTLDEASLLRTTIGQLRRIGVELIAVIDRGSTDGSLEIIADEERHGDLWLVQAPAEDAPHARGIWTALAKASAADWVLFLDSDELWLPATGSLHDLTQLEHADLLYVPRYNTVLAPDGAHMPDPPTVDAYEQTLVYALGIPDAAQAIRADPSLPWIRAELDPKVLVRREVLEDIARGAHDIVPVEGRQVRTWWARELLIAHLPFTTEERFARKMGNVESTVARRPDLFQQNQGWQWSMWAGMGQGQARAELDRQRVDGAALEGLRAAGIVCSVAELLQPLVPEPEALADPADPVRPWIPALVVLCLRHRIRPAGAVALIDASRGADGRPTVVRFALPRDHEAVIHAPADEADAPEASSTVPDWNAPGLGPEVARGDLTRGWRYTVHERSVAPAVVGGSEA